MSFDRILRDMIRDELRGVLAPLSSAIAELQRQGNLQSQLQSLLGQGAKRGPGRPRKVPVGLAALTQDATGKARRGRKPKRSRESSDRGCMDVNISLPFSSIK